MLYCQKMLGKWGPWTENIFFSNFLRNHWVTSNHTLYFLSDHNISRHRQTLWRPRSCYSSCLLVTPAETWVWLRVMTEPEPEDDTEQRRDNADTRGTEKCLESVDIMWEGFLFFTSNYVTQQNLHILHNYRPRGADLQLNE